MKVIHCQMNRKFFIGELFHFPNNLPDKCEILGQTGDNCLQFTRNGGAVILGSAGKIDIKNTFDERLHLLEVEALPSVRVTLFGENEHRKFRD